MLGLGLGLGLGLVLGLTWVNFRLDLEIYSLTTGLWDYRDSGFIISSSISLNLFSDYRTAGAVTVYLGLRFL